MNTLEIVVAQSPAELNGPQARLAWLKHSLTLDIVQGADVLLLPELFLTGYNIGEKVNVWCETFDGPYAEQIAALCQQHDIAIHYGFAEKVCPTGRPDKIYNSANCIGRDGKHLSRHRKLLLPPGFEGDHFNEGEHSAPFTINGFRISTLICYDAEFPENFRHVAQQEVDLVLVPTALASQWGIVAHKLIPTRAFENGVFVCYANQAGNEHGLEYSGASCIIAPDGSELQRASHRSEFIRATLNQEKVRAAQTRLPYLQDVKRL